MSGRLEIRLLGPLEVSVDGVAVSVGGPKPRMLLATLALHEGRTVSTDQLVEVLWPRHRPRSATANLQTYISSLRVLLGPGRLQTRPPGYRAVLSADELDLRRFQELLDAGTELTAALALWRGEPVEDLPREPFWQAQIDALVQQWRGARLVVARLAVDSGRAADVLADLRALVAEDPLREEAWLVLVRALADTGQRAEALGAYAQMRRLLAEELGIEPSEPLRRLHRQLLIDGPVTAAPLDADAALVVRALAVLGLGSAPAWTAAAVLDRPDATEVLAALSGARLLRRDARGRYGVPALVGLLAPDLPGEPPDGGLTRVLGGYLWLADAARKALPAQVFGPGTRVAPRWTVAGHAPPGPDWFADERDALVRGVELAGELGRSDLAWELAHALVRWCDLRGRTAEWERTHRAALAACRKADDLLGEAVTLRGLGQLHVYQDHYDAAVEAFGRSRLLFARLGNDCGLAAALAGLGTVHRIRGELDEAYRCFRQVLASYRTAGDLAGQALAHGALAQVLVARGAYEAAVRSLDAGDALAIRLDDRHRLAHLRHLRGQVLLRTQDGAARPVLCRALELFVALGDAQGQAYCLMDLAQLEPGESAVARLTEALDVVERIGDRLAQATCARRLGELHRQAGRIGLGGAYLDEAQRIRATVPVTSAVPASGGR